MHRLSILATIALAISLLPFNIIGQQRAVATKNSSTRAASKALPQLSIIEFTLPNGLDVILHQDRSTPIVALSVYYHVGSRDEAPGRTGFAHLFEHMLFQGSKNYPGIFFKPLEEAGGLVNGTTDNDRTLYFEVVPSNFLELALFLEADRMGNLLEAMTQEKLDNQRDVVKNEKRQRLDNQPYGLAPDIIAKTMYPEGHPYRWLPIGSMEDLTAASMDDVRGFFQRYYVPNNATLVVAGDFDAKEARSLVEKYFGTVKRGAPVKRADAPTPVLEREIRRQEEDDVSLPRVYITWRGARPLTDDEADLEILSNVLAVGKSSRLFKRLMYETQLTQQVSANNDPRQLAGEFQIVATAKPGKTLGEIEEVINQEINRIKEEPPTQAEVDRAYNITESSFIFGLQTVLSKSIQLNHYNFLNDRPDFFKEDLARYRRVTPAAVQRAAKKFLTGERFVLSIIPRTSPRQSETQGMSGTRQSQGPTPTQEQKPPAGAKPAAADAVEDKFSADASKLPAAGANPKLRLPQLQRRKLSNGLEVIFVEHHELPVVNMSLVVKAGGAADPRDRAGLAYLTSALLDEGTKTRTALEISDRLGSVGASLNTFADWDATSLSLQTMSHHLGVAIDVFSDVITNPSFPADELERQRAARLAAIKQQRVNPNALSGNIHPLLVYGRSHPYGHVLQGDDNSVGAVTAEEVRRFYETYYRPNNAALIIVGDVKPSALTPQLERAFAQWQSRPVPAVNVAAPVATRDSSAIYLVDKPGSVQSVLSVGHALAPRAASDYFPMLVLNRVFGGTSSSRLFMNLRERKGYTYGAFSTFDFRRGAGFFAAQSAVRTAVTKESIQEILKEMRGVRGEIPITSAELEYAKQSIIRSYPRGFETTGQIASRLTEIVIYDLPDDYFNQYLEQVSAVTLSDLKRAADQQLLPSRTAILVVGDRKAVEPHLRELDGISATITLLDADGRVIAAGANGGPTESKQP